MFGLVNVYQITSLNFIELSQKRIERIILTNVPHGEERKFCSIILLENRKSKIKVENSKLNWIFPTFRENLFLNFLTGREEYFAPLKKVPFYLVGNEINFPVRSAKWYSPTLYALTYSMWNRYTQELGSCFYRVLYTCS